MKGIICSFARYTLLSLSGCRDSLSLFLPPRVGLPLPCCPKRRSEVRRALLRCVETAELLAHLERSLSVLVFLSLKAWQSSWPPHTHRAVTAVIFLSITDCLTTYLSVRLHLAVPHQREISSHWHWVGRRIHHQSNNYLDACLYVPFLNFPVLVKFICWTYLLLHSIYFRQNFLQIYWW